MIGAACRLPAAIHCRWTCRCLNRQRELRSLSRLLRRGHIERCQGQTPRTARRSQRRSSWGGGNGEVWHSHIVAAAHRGDPDPSLPTIQEKDAEECPGMFDPVAAIVVITRCQETAKCVQVCNMGGQYPSRLSLRWRTARAGDGVGRVFAIVITTIIEQYCPQIY